MPSAPETSLPNLVRRGKVRDIYDLGDRLMLVASDRISAFDVVMEQAIPDKGKVLTALTEFWFNTLPACKPHHLISIVRDTAPVGYEAAMDQLSGRATLCRKAEVIPVECVVRGYVVGGGWKEYEQTGSVSGVKLPAGLRLAERLDQPIFTPSTKADSGHDEPISFDQACEIAGRETMERARARSLAIYNEARDFAATRGLILADTKFEFGYAGGELLLIDEVLTPDSSRYWPADEWKPGQNPPSFDKQFLRDYLETCDWDKTPPPPALPSDIVAKTRARYLEAYRLLTGRELGV
ncbi:MAG: phosphoribosylaminoimidazolesuccinocarboxamide synthase [Phycisphaerales bacterium]|nr:phosphoribosylaminoimidazolesuccinocarboxamide synthase [Phycisphaerales bacterium]